MISNNIYLRNTTRELVIIRAKKCMMKLKWKKMTNYNNNKSMPKCNSSKPPSKTKWKWVNTKKMETKKTKTMVKKWKKTVNKTSLKS